MTGPNVYQHYQRVLAGTPLRPSADVDGTPSVREGKDQNYAGIISLVDIFLPRREDRCYVGLPANQLDTIASNIGGSIVAVERDPKRAGQLEQLKKFTEMRHNVRIEVVNDDIICYLSRYNSEIEEYENENKYNIFDLDLMCHLPSYPYFTDYLYRTAKLGFSLIHITTCVGRKITVDEYETRVVRFSRSLASSGFESIGHSRFSYRDRITPMRSERFIVRKTGEEE